MKNTFSKIRKIMMKNIKYTSLIYLNNTYCMNEKNFKSNNNLNYTYFVNNNNSKLIQKNINYINNDNPQHLYFGNNVNSKLIQKNINYTNNDNPQHLCFGNNVNSKLIQKNINYINNDNPQHLYFGNNVNSKLIQKNINNNINSAFTPYNANNNTNIKNINVNNINDYNNAKIISNIGIKNKIIINENEEISQKEHRNEEKEKVVLNKKRGRLKKKNKKYCPEDFRKENLINRIFCASLRFIQYKANELLRKAGLTNIKITKIYTFNNVSKKYCCIKELFGKNIEEILRRNSNKNTSKKDNNEIVINIIKRLDGQNDKNLLILKNFLETNNEVFFKENINVEALTNYDENFKNFYKFYETNDESRKKIEDYTNNFVDKIKSIKTRNERENNINNIFEATQI